MLDNIIYFLFRYTYIISGFLFLVKTFLFLKHKNRNWKFTEFFYFNQMNIRFTASTERAKLKRIQNVLSLVIILLLFIQLFTLIIFGSTSLGQGL